MKKYLLLLLLLHPITLPQSSYAAGDIEIAGDALQILIPSIAYGTTLYLDDNQGENQMVQSFFTNLAITHGLKRAINKERPNGGNHSFPSGHTSAAFQGASFIHARYGLTYSIPAYIAATFVGYSRVESNHHYTNDVIAGAALGTACGFYFTDPSQSYSLQPVAVGGSFGLQISGHW